MSRAAEHTKKNNPTGSVPFIFIKDLWILGKTYHPMEPVPFLNLRGQYEKIKEQIRPVIDEVLDSQICIGGPHLVAFEKEICQATGAAHAVGCSNGSDALVLALKALDIGPGDEVICPSFTFFATAGSVRMVGATPVFADIEPGTFNIDVGLLPGLVTKNTKAVIPVDLFGQVADLTAVNDFARAHKIKVIEDAAQAIGAEHKNKRAGSLSDLTTFSFYPTKNLGACGEGGKVTTNDADLAKKLEQLRNHGQTGRYEHAFVGLNARLPSLQAAILRIKLQHLDDWTSTRQAHAQAYRELLANVPHLTLPTVGADSTRHVYNQFVVRLKNRDAIQQGLQSQGIGCGVYYPMPLHLQPCFEDLGYKVGHLPMSESACKEVLALPCYPELKSSQVQQVAKALKALCEK
jgi:dTDP-4-amino-4,6-dideoxygalactose transaminase